MSTAQFLMNSQFLSSAWPRNAGGDVRPPAAAQSRSRRRGRGRGRSRSRSGDRKYNVQTVITNKQYKHYPTN